MMKSRLKLKLNKKTLRDLDERDNAKEQLKLTVSTSCITCTGCTWTCPAVQEQERPQDSVYR